MTGYTASGLDMGCTLEWYNSSGVCLPTYPLDRPFPFPVEGKDFIALSDADLGGLLHLFPENARNRLALRKVVGERSLWFHKDSLGNALIPTPDPREALSLTAIIPSYTDYSHWEKLNPSKADIFLYQIQDNAAPEHVKRIVLAEGFIHELGHCIAQPAISLDNYFLKFPNGEIIEGFSSICNFGTLAENCPPMSHYSSTYRRSDNTFKGKKDRINPFTPITEELSESIAAFLLGFVYSDDEQRRRYPFYDRPEVYNWVNDFLHAELVIK